ncbi:twin-arginine translocation signal domain-containing protein [Roseovarius gahaiensis]|uniref:Twin-arginine translocation signal domain-containing protein n=1 Tax=Roseovarius gahaiensis TaxID=2716691 RepID=A0A967EGW4_9RHOB|nr:LPS assembly lipoprotein LptE [Roseovarius gahaiensis]NHQ75481.1 twin-arginine translocation signal domain-containing protein [Roseovarius gahaiensis]
MSSSDRRSFLKGAAAAATVAGLAGCGFSPAYAPGGAASRLRNAVSVVEPEGRAGYLMTRELEDRLGRASDPRYALIYAVELTQLPVAITNSNIATRFNLTGEATYALSNRSTGAVLLSGTVDNFNSFSAFGSTVARQAAERAAEERLVTILADQMVARLIAGAADLPA